MNTFLITIDDCVYSQIDDFVDHRITTDVYIPILNRLSETLIRTRVFDLLCEQTEVHNECCGEVSNHPSP